MSKCVSRPAAFTLVEVLTALALMAIVIPVAMRGMQIANRAGVVAQRKALAARIGEKVLNEAIITGNQSAQSGTEQAGPYQFRWTTHNDPWTQLATSQTVISPNGVNTSVVNSSAIHELSVDVVFSAQNRDYSVHLSTLVNTLLQPTTPISLP